MVFDRIIQLDRYVIDRVQTAYLWLFDWTGCYVATIVAMMVLVCVAMMPFNWLAITLVAMLLLIIAGRYLDQEKQRYAKFNFESRQWRDSFSRRIHFTLIFLSLSIAIVDGRWLSVTAGIISFFAFGFLWCVQIREREPKEWRVAKPAGALS